MVSAITDGLLSKNILNPSAVSADCATGNCTFPDYTSLAVCSSAEDATPLIEALGCPRAQQKARPGCKYTVSPLQKTSSIREDTFAPDKSGIPALWISASNTLSGQNPLMDFYVLYFPDLSIFSGDSDANVTASLIALKVSISLCLKTYHTNVTNGQTTTTVIDTQLPDFTEQQLTPTAENSAANKMSATDKKGTEYYMESFTYLHLSQYLSTATFYGTYDMSTPEFPTLAHTADSDAARAFGEIFYNNPPPDHVAAIKPMLANIETSMSNALRDSSINPETAFGTPYYTEVFISVDFRWLIVPILSIALSLLLIVAVAAETRRKHIPVWKDGLSKVLCALEPGTRFRIEELGESREGAGHVPVVLARKDDEGRGWWLKESREG